MNITQEKKLLLLCLKTELNSKAINEIIQLIEKKLDWQKLVTEARLQGIASFIYYNLSQIPDKNLITDNCLLELKQDYVETTGRNIAIFEELKNLLTILKQAEIDVVVLKGPALVKTVYFNLAFRFMCDIDLLVRKKDLSKAQDCLLKHGYIQERQVSKNNLMESHHLPGFRSNKKGAKIEIHWTLLKNYNIFNIDIDEIWTRVQTCKISNIDTLILSPEDMILHLCFHLCVGHVSEMTFRRLYDIAATIQHHKDSINWDQIVKCSMRYKIVAPVYSGLRLAHDLFSTNIPSDILTQLRSKCSNKQLKLLEMMSYNSVNIKGALAVLLFWSNSYQGKIKLILSRTFPSVEFLSFRYSLPLNSKIVYFYYMIRPISLLANSVISIVKLMISFSATYLKNLSNRKLNKDICSITDHFFVFFAKVLK